MAVSGVCIIYFASILFKVFFVGLTKVFVNNRTRQFFLFRTKIAYSATCKITLGLSVLSTLDFEAIDWYVYD